MRSSIASSRSCSSLEAPGSTNENISTLSNWWTRKMPRVSRPAAPAPRREQGRKGPGGAGLAAEAGREGAVAQRQLTCVEDLAGVEAGEADLGGAGEEELVLGDFVDLVAVAGQEAGPLQRLFADEDRGDDRLVALAADQLDREADQRQLEQDQVPLQIGEARAGELGRLLHLDQAQLSADLEVVARLEVELGPLADLADDDRILLGHPFRRIGVGEVGQRQGQFPQLGLDRLQLRLRRL